LIAVHMFVFYFGILADDTPPVALAAFAAAAISKGDPIKTGIQGFMYDIRTAILPFLFIFNTELLMIGVDSWYLLLTTIVTAVTAMLLFAAATQGFFIVKCRLWEVLALMLIAFTLFRPGFWMDEIFPPLESISASEIFEAGILDGRDLSAARIDIRQRNFRYRGQDAGGFSNPHPGRGRGPRRTRDRQGGHAAARCGGQRRGPAVRGRSRTPYR
jgi:hypothetical protein